MVQFGAVKMVKNAPQKLRKKTVRPLRSRGQKRGRRGSKKVEAGGKPPQIGTTWFDFFFILGALFDNFYHSDPYHFSFLL